MSVKVLKINKEDNVVVAIEALSAREVITVGDKSIRLAEAIPAGHKIALVDFNPGDNVIKYGFPIGHAVCAIAQGGIVNEKNIRTNLSGVLEYSYTPRLESLSIPIEHRTFAGYKRANGEVGIRNEIVVLPTVGCVNGTVNKLADMLRRETREEGVDAIVAYTHNYGCSQLGNDHENTRKILRDIVLHPNIGGVLVVGLGCENNQVSAFKTLLGDAIDPTRVKFMETQKVDDELEVGMTLLREIYAVVTGDQRSEVPLSALRLGLKCGGSDGFSGITANPLLGVVSDYIIAQGGTSVLTEVPEMFGAETQLMDRSVDARVFDKTVRLINDFKEYFIRNNQPVYENPSPGNKAGGISTLEEKSLGCTQKCGKSVVKDVLSYADRLQVSGLNLLSAPGNDLVAATALASAGCQIVLFTTGRGTPFGTYVPTMKISTNTPLYNAKRNWIDFNAGTIVETETMDTVSARFIDYLIQVASGKLVNNEKSGFKEIAIFKTGVTL